MPNTLLPQTRHILVVDDDPRCRSLVRRIVDRGGDEFWEGADGTEALELYRRHQPDLLVIDLEMKPMDGLDATRAIIADYPGARIVMVSQHNSPAIIAEAARAGARHFVSKTDLLSLSGLLDELLPYP